jgi:hypothetical protein
MAIRVERNEQGNCVNFHGSSNPTYWNACLTASVDEAITDTINVVNDIITAQTGVTEYEFYQIPFTEFTRADNSDFSTAQEAADYITAAARVVGISPDSTGNDLTGETVCFKLDDTSTSIIIDNGYSFGVNTIKAVAEGGVIELHSITGDRTLFSNLDAANVCINDLPVSGGLNDVVNTLNELFTVGAFESVVISDPYSTMIADVGGVAAGHTLVGSTAIDPIGDDIFTNSSSGNYAGLLSTETIDQAGEYFTFDIRGEGQIGFGLVHTQDSYDNGYFSGNTNYANPTTFATSNSAHYGFQFSHWFHPTPNGSWTNYGANTSYSMREHWSSNWDKKQDWLDGNNVKVRVGLDTNGFISIETLNDDGSWGVHARTSYPASQGAEFRLGVKTANSSARVSSSPKVHLLEPEAPTMYFRYIESPDGNFEYPLFATAEEANYYDEQNGGIGTSHTHTYSDDPTNTTWYMPDTNGVMNGTSAPAADLTLGQAATYTEITSLTNADLTPAQFSQANITQEEGTNINLPISPVDVTYSTSVSISPAGSGLVYNTVTQVLQGTLADVGTDTTYTITVTRANSYGSSVGSFTITATDVAPVQTNDTPWTKALDFNGSSEHLKQVSSSMYNQALQMNGLASQVNLGTRSQGETSNSSTSRPWATSVVFKSDGHNSNQIIWNQGEGSSNGNDNIYLRLSSSGSLFFGWGREGSGYNECRVINQTVSSSTWYGVSVAHSGVRLGGNNASASNLADCFDIRVMSSADSFNSISSNLSISSNWIYTGNRMDRTVAGDFTLGGRGNSTYLTYRGKIASMVITTLIGDGNYTSAQLPSGFMPDADQAKMMITDPIKWVDDYKIRYSSGNPNGLLRTPASRYAQQPFLIGSSTSGYSSTQVWLMGDGTSDSYSNGVRNYVNTGDQNQTKLQLNSMVSNDFETVNINGLT